MTVTRPDADRSNRDTGQHSTVVVPHFTRERQATPKAPQQIEWYDEVGFMGVSRTKAELMARNQARGLQSSMARKSNLFKKVGAKQSEAEFPDHKALARKLMEHAKGEREDKIELAEANGFPLQ